MYHTVIVVGNLGQDPELRYLPNGTAMTNFSVATSRQYTGSDGNLVKETCWFRVSVFGRTAEVCSQYLKKGRKVLVEGNLRPDPATGGPRLWTGNDGNTRASYELNAQTVRFLSSRGEDDYSPAGGDYSHQAGDGGDDNIPF